MKNLRLHLGVHKTATTHIQSRLYNSKSALEEAGVGYLGLDETREKVTSLIKRNMVLGDDFKSFLDSHESVLISDENILGGTAKPKSPVLYEQAAERVKALLGAISFESLSVHLTIRDPESYLVSRYCEYLRHYKFMPVHEYFDEIFLRKFSWMPLVKKLEEAAGVSVEVTTFEELFDAEQNYFDRLLGKKISLKEASKNPSIKRSKVSNEAYEILLEVSEHFPGHVTRKLMNMISNNKQFTKKTPLKPFGSDLSSHLKDNYEKDKKALGIV